MSHENMTFWKEKRQTYCAAVLNATTKNKTNLWLVTMGLFGLLPTLALPKNWLPTMFWSMFGLLPKFWLPMGIHLSLSQILAKFLVKCGPRIP
jgi:hypothetical protein